MILKQRNLITAKITTTNTLMYVISLTTETHLDVPYTALVRP